MMMQSITIALSLASLATGFVPVARSGFLGRSTSLFVAESVEVGDIITTAIHAGSFTTLSAALDAANLVDTLRGPGPFTVFAPTDEAFAKLPDGTVNDLLHPENKIKLAEILSYHVLLGEVMADTVVTMDGQKATTLNGAEVTIRVKDGKVTVDDATIITTDVKTSNGVIHVIDSVMIPK
ncbi:Beta-Ig-H3 fasciclin [Fragilaria crotonensis]|nr:Beta-Ig-H3 fasciclin [Fragilaria crotonensis]